MARKPQKQVKFDGGFWRLMSNIAERLGLEVEVVIQHLAVGRLAVLAAEENAFGEPVPIFELVAGVVEGEPIPKQRVFDAVMGHYEERFREGAPADEGTTSVEIPLSAIGLHNVIGNAN